MKKILSIVLFLCFVGISFSNSWDLPGISLITREQWGADSKYLFSDYKEYKTLIEKNNHYLNSIKKDKKKWKIHLDNVYKKETREKYLFKNYKNDVRADKVIKEINGKKLRWNMVFKNDKDRIIIHHTVVDYNKFNTKEEIEKYIRGTYYFHAIKRGWGDIGYNFLIDKFGNIYEGRAGGEGVVGANSKWNNVKSIGIALIGNFEIQKPTEKQLESLENLIFVLSKKYHINPYKQVTYHKEDKYKYPYLKDIKNVSIVGHRDTGYTACPGKYMYLLIPKVREDISNRLKKNITKPVSVNDYKVSYLSFGKKLTFTNKIVLKSSKFLNLKKCEGNIKNVKIYCDKNQIVIERKGYVGFRTYNFTVYGYNVKYNISFYPIFMDDIRVLMNKKAEKYLGNKQSKYSIRKINYNVSLEEAKKYIKQNVKVLLYELSLKNFYDISCTKTCKLITDKKTLEKVREFKIDKLGNSLLLWVGTKSYSVKYIDISSNGGEIVFNEYKRQSYAHIPWNTFKGSVIIKQNPIKYISTRKTENKYVVINLLPFDDYLKGVAEVNDQVSFEKARTMALLIKSYVLFYFNKKNIHPSIPENASYNVIDDPRSFQKYVGAGYERTSKKWNKVLDSVKNIYLVYKNNIPILPYFNCSPGFTFSAKQKFGWVDTPYLQNSIDLGKCKSFNGHGVGLSGKGAEYLAKKGLKMEQIIQWYFLGIRIVKSE